MFGWCVLTSQHGKPKKNRSSEIFHKLNDDSKRCLHRGKDGKCSVLRSAGGRGRFTHVVRKQAQLHALRLHTGMMDFFLFRNLDWYYIYAILQFGWGSSAMGFTNLILPQVQYKQEKWLWLVLPYLDDYLRAPTQAELEDTAGDCSIPRAYGPIVSRLGAHPSSSKISGRVRRSCMV